MLRAMTVGEILDGTFSLLRKDFVNLFAIVAVCEGPGKALQLYATFNGGAAAHPFMLLISLALVSVGAVVAGGAVLQTISQDYLGAPVSASDAISAAFDKFGTLFTAGLAKVIVVFLALLLLIVPGIIVACGYACVAQIAMLERLGSGTDALGRSWDLTRGHRGRAFGLGCALWVIYFVPSIAVAAMVAMMPLHVLGLSVAGTLLELVLLPLFPCAFTLFYYDLRIRKEGFDLEVLTRQLSAASA